LHCRFAFAVGQIIFHNTLHTVKLLLLSCLYFSSTHTRDEWLFGGANGSGGPSKTSRGEQGGAGSPYDFTQKRAFRVSERGKRSAMPSAAVESFRATERSPRAFPRLLGLWKLFPPSTVKN